MCPKQRIMINQPPKEKKIRKYVRTKQNKIIHILTVCR